VKKVVVEENNTPALLLISSNTVDRGPLVNEVFVSLQGETPAAAVDNVDQQRWGATAAPDYIGEYCKKR